MSERYAAAIISRSSRVVQDINCVALIQKSQTECKEKNESLRSSVYVIHIISTSLISAFQLLRTVFKYKIQLRGAQRLCTVCFLLFPILPTLSSPEAANNYSITQLTQYTHLLFALCFEAQAASSLSIAFSVIKSLFLFGAFSFLHGGYKK